MWSTGEGQSGASDVPFVPEGVEAYGRVAIAPPCGWVEKW